MNNQQDTNYFPALTGLRAIAAFMVYFHHFNPINKSFFGDYTYNFFTQLHIGVSLFFVLSGFLITYRYYNKPKVDFKKYIINRFARIYPMYFIMTSLTVLFGILFVSPLSLSDFKLYLLNITFLRGFFDDFKFTFVAQGWSLTVEEFFYFLAPFLFLLVKKNKLFLIFTPIVFMLLGCLFVFTFKDFSYYGLMKNITFMLEFTFFGRCYEFILGMTLAIFLNKFAVNKIPFVTYLGIFVVIVLVFALSILSFSVHSRFDKIITKIIDLILLPTLGFVPLIIGLIYNRTYISKMLTTSLFQILGKSSYVFYLIHMGVVVYVLNKISTNYIFLFISLNIIAIIMYMFLESPINRYIRNRFSSKK